MKHTEKGSAFTGIVLETFKLGGLFVAEGDKLSAPLGLTSARWKVLGSLAYSEVPLTVSQVARNMGQSRQAVQTIVNILSDAGLVELQNNPAHKRARLVSLTASGKEIYQRMMAIQTPWANQCADHVSLEELETTLKTLKRLANLF